MKNTGTLKVTTPGDREIVMARVFDAPRNLVFDAMTKSELLQRWLLGPPGWSMVICESDPRVGGAFRHVWRKSNGTEMAMRGVYREVVSPERIVRTESFEFGCDPQAGEQLATAVLVEQGGTTTLTITVLYPSKEARDATIASGMEHGAAASYDRLADLLTGSDKPTSPNADKHDLVVTRVFDAPVERVWKAWTDSEQVMQWWGPNGFTCPLAKMDFRVGGISLVCMRAPKEFGGQDMHSTWEYRRIEPMRRIEFIHNLADKDGNKTDPVQMGLPPDFPRDQRQTVTFQPVGDGQTEMTVTEYDWTAGQMMEMARLGLEQCLDKMAAIFAKG